MAAKRKKTEDRPKARRGDAAGFAAIRMWTNALETAMIKRYVGNAPTLRPIRAVVREALRAIKRIKPLAMSDCPDYLTHEPGCNCGDPAI